MKKSILSLIMIAITLVGCSKQTIPVDTSTEQPDVLFTMTPHPSVGSTPTMHIQTVHPIKPNTATATVTPSATAAIEKIPPTPEMWLTQTIQSGVIITDPDKSCQRIPDPAITVSDTDNIHLQGVFCLCRQWPLPLLHGFVYFDLDQGSMGNEDNTNADLKYSIRSTIDGIAYEIFSQNDASFYDVESSIPSLDTCLGQIDKGKKAGGIAAEEENACIVTTEGRVAFIHVEELNPYGWGSIEISFVTWEK